jgi:hypothetical protein
MATNAPRPWTQIYDPSTSTARDAADCDTVYVLSNRDRTYRHTTHRIERIDAARNLAVTYCDIWMIAGGVEIGSEDCYIWCENGCKEDS